MGLALHVLRDQWKDATRRGSDHSRRYRRMHCQREMQEVKRKITFMVYSPVPATICKIRHIWPLDMYEKLASLHSYLPVISIYISLNSSADEVEVTNFNWPKDKVLDWILGPLLIIKEQVRKLQLKENEEACLRKLILVGKNEKPEDWDEVGFPSDDNVRRAQLQAILRRYP